MTGSVSRDNACLNGTDSLITGARLQILSLTLALRAFLRSAQVESGRKLIFNQPLAQYFQRGNDSNHWLVNNSR
jgi:hypothetical protein